MYSLLRAAAAATLLLAVPGVAQAQAWVDWGERSARELITAEHGTVTEVTVGADGELHIYATFDGWLHMLLIGTDCNGQGTNQRCKRLGFNALFEVDDTTRALALEREMILAFVAHMADGEDLVLHREVDLTGGVSLVNIRAQLDRFIRTCEQASDQIWPATDGKGPTKPR